MKTRKECVDKLAQCIQVQSGDLSIEICTELAIQYITYVESCMTDYHWPSTLYRLTVGKK